MGTKEEAIDDLMGKIEKLRSSELYVHRNCMCITRKIARSCAKREVNNMEAKMLYRYVEVFIIQKNK